SGASITLYDAAAEESKLRAVERVTRSKLPIKDAPVELAPAPAPRAATPGERPQKTHRKGGMPQKPRRAAPKARDHRGAAHATAEAAPKAKRPFRRKRRNA
ncbi:hypothetical protein LNK20_20055, partial [Bacillus safensis]|nr:hypothetical protein [Bacillus safensis]